VPRRSTSSKPNTVACTARQGSRSDVPRVDVSDTHRLKSLEDENAKLKRLLADTMLDNVVLKDLLEKNLRHRTCDGLQHARQCGITRGGVADFDAERIEENPFIVCKQTTAGQWIYAITHDHGPRLAGIAERSLATQAKAKGHDPFPLSWFAGKPLPGSGPRFTVH
jgi:hypothetical protein